MPRPKNPGCSPCLAIFTLSLALGSSYSSSASWTCSLASAVEALIAKISSITFSLSLTSTLQSLASAYACEALSAESKRTMSAPFSFTARASSSAFPLPTPYFAWCRKPWVTRPTGSYPAASASASASSMVSLSGRVTRSALFVLRFQSACRPRARRGRLTD